MDTSGNFFGTRDVGKGVEKMLKHFLTLFMPFQGSNCRFYNNFELILQSTIRPQINNLQYTGKIWLKSTNFAQKPTTMQIYKSTI